METEIRVKTPEIKAKATKEEIKEILRDEIMPTMAVTTAATETRSLLNAEWNFVLASGGISWTVVTFFRPFKWPRGGR
jgi:hypothetical protein